MRGLRMPAAGFCSPCLSSTLTVEAEWQRQELSTSSLELSRTRSNQPLHFLAVCVMLVCTFCFLYTA